MMRAADLHLHSDYSDGTFSPKKVVESAAKAGLSCVSITDHDTVDGLEEAFRASEAHDVEVLAGVELTAESQGCEVHILGYLIDEKDADFLKVLDEIRQTRVKRIYAICDKFRELNVCLEPQEVFAISGHGTVGRLHVARVLCEKGVVFSVNEAFYKYIGDKGPAYVSRFKMTPQEAIQWILRVGGVPVLAHPYSVRERISIPDLVKMGLAGIEVFYAEHLKSETQKYVEIAKSFDLLMTGGSDCHGLAKEEVRLGQVKLPYEYVEKLKDTQCRMKQKNT
jgi:predicted metal-dependent phosphoesterase TrpH